MKLKLTELMEKITPLPWATGCRMTQVEVLPPGWNAPLLVADCHGRHAPESEDERVANAEYLVHSANVLPKLVEALSKTLARIDHLHDVERAEWKDDDANVFNEAAAILTLAREVEI